MLEGKILEKLEEHSQMLSDHKEQMAFLRENMVSQVEFKALKEEFRQFREEFDDFRKDYMNGQDQVMSILKRLDEERLSTHFRLTNIEKIVAQHEERLATI